MRSAAYIWAKVIGLLEERLDAVTVSSLFDDAEPVALNDATFILYTPSDFRQETILRCCKQHIEEILGEQIGLDVTLCVWSDAEMEARKTPSDNESLWKINPHFSFETFIASEDNLVPLKAAMHVAQSPGDTVYNPLYYYGPPGVGKTHLLYSIANKASQLHPNAKILYIKGDQFTNELIRSLQTGKNSAFRKKYRDADLLLIDNVQFIAGKETTQEEFFHTFNALYEERKQIVLTSDRAPNDMPLLEDRLRGRFGEGVMVKIQPPDLETRKQIIRLKAKDLALPFDDESVDFLGRTLCDNVRQIEGGLRKIRAYRDLSGMPLTLSHIAKTVADIQTSETCAVVTPDTVVRYVSKYYGVSEAQLKSIQRSKDIAQPRQIAMFLIRDMTPMRLQDIGKYFGRDHGTVHHSIQKVQNLLDGNDETTAHIIKDIRLNIEANT